ncbi:MAG: peptidase M23 [Flavobacteriaceae bacterium]|nr:peptidase M23 [Flavobacteriaceae bacterium]|tara:strand:- start:27152 stop:28018 length:867 start_codon:yes stop_codon:yes gene_type:complete
MTPKRVNKKKLKKTWLHKYRLVVLNEDTFEEKLNIRLTRLNVFIVSALLAIVVVFLTTTLIAFTPLREYIPGYTLPTLQGQAIRLDKKTDSLLQISLMNERYINSIKKALSGEAAFESINKDSIYDSVESEIDLVGLQTSNADSLLRAKVDNEDKYNLFESATAATNFLFFPPVNGSVSSPFDLSKQHYAVDIVVSKGTPVKAAAAGRVVLASWTSDSGYVIIIDHGNQLLSVYKHNANLTKRQGDLVRAQEVIANSGSSGELSTGPHLHFELWYDGNPIDPETFINF